MGRKAFYANALHGAYGALTLYSFVIRFGRPPPPVTRFINWGRLLFGWFKFYYGRFAAWGRIRRQRSWAERRSWGPHEGYKPNRLKLKCVQIGFDFFPLFILMSRLSCAFTFRSHCASVSCVDILDGALVVAWVEPRGRRAERAGGWVVGCIHSRTMNGNRLTAST